MAAFDVTRRWPDHWPKSRDGRGSVRAQVAHDRLVHRRVLIGHVERRGGDVAGLAVRAPVPARRHVDQAATRADHPERDPGHAAGRVVRKRRPSDGRSSPRPRRPPARRASAASRQIRASVGGARRCRVWIVGAQTALRRPRVAASNTAIVRRGDEVQRRAHQGRLDHRAVVDARRRGPRSRGPRGGTTARCTASSRAGPGARPGG